ncbi:SDR family oxidoreductase [Comamonas sp. 26]|uniref:SDR family oxidoreductase n=1 Tax=Comamonas sp. 26 TaxID=2035201 RepID=UPI000C19EA5C|nr:SDR family oxidoreductase [Comamonas sp. 26]PIG00694.1 NAD(P)-dependent dehydrogenase (short-subunit alcohol dehydrogenase family) [Comamonas sp. 26]
MKSILILGTSRGLGRALTEAYLAQGQRVIATVRKSEDMAPLQALGAQVLKVDLADPASVSGLAWQLDGKSIDLALYVAGVWDGHAAGVPPTQQQFDKVMHSNVLGFMQALPQIAPMVQETGGVIAAFSSEMSLLGSADESAWLYRVSKAALNMAVASACQQWPGLTLLALDPGWTQTDMGGPGATVPLADSVKGLMNVLAQVQPEDRGSLWRYDGTKTELLGA